MTNPQVQITNNYSCDSKRIESLIQKSHSILYTKVEALMADLTNLQREVSEMAGVIDSAIVLINGLAEEIRAAGTDQVKLDELAASLDSKAGELAAAVAANTATDAPTE